MKREEILRWLKETDPQRLEELWGMADSVRKEAVGDEVHLRGLVEISNYCVMHCGYCGLRVDNRKIERYRMTADEIVACAHEAVSYGYGTVVLQSGQDYGITAEWMSSLIRRIRKETNLAVTLSLGERSDKDLVAWREAGADRYLLRFETSNRELFSRIHPSLRGRKSDRIQMLRRIKQFGYETGSGVMIGIPGQTYDDLTTDIETFRFLDLDMIGVGPFIPHPDTPLGQKGNGFKAPDSQQVPNSEEMTYKVVALARLVCPKANIPSTTALATLNRDYGRELGLMRGANVIMPNLTPPQYRAKYEIYPAKACVGETAWDCSSCMQMRIRSIGRIPGKGRGDSPNFRPVSRDGVATI